MAFAKMTIAIASFQRRSSLMRLLHTLDDQLQGNDDLREHLDIVVVLDGSTDGSLEAVRAQTWSVPVHARWQPNRGLAAARNVGLDAAAGGIVWFLDDDVVPSPGLIERHRRAHDAVPPFIMVGPCRIPPGTVGPEEVLRWWAAFNSRLRPGQPIDRYELFTAANASGPASLFSSAGGFDETFVTYGLEDYELAVRLLGAGTRIIFDADAVAWHPELEAVAVHVGREHDIGLNSTRVVQRHPETLELLFPEGVESESRRLLRALRLRRPAALTAVSRAAFRISRLTRWHRPTARRAERLARCAAFASGVSEGDAGGALLDRYLNSSSDSS
jgi:glycosyltransferase involved in cell wall biosynthesis